jgi:hypothetical protein
MDKWTKKGLIAATVMILGVVLASTGTFIALSATRNLNQSIYGVFLAVFGILIFYRGCKFVIIEMYKKLNAKTTLTGDRYEPRST